MAREITSITRQARRPQKYPWDEWTDGRARRLLRGEDYDALSSSMAAMLRNHALRYGLGVETALLRDADGVEFRFYPLERDAA